MAVPETPPTAGAPPAAPRPTPDLTDTRTAFAHLSDADLRRAELLFRVIGNKTVSDVGAALTKAALWLRLPVKGAIKATIFRQFCGGENRAEGLRTAERLAHASVNSILDYSVEGQEDDATLDHTCEEIIATIEQAKGRGFLAFAVFKPSGISPVALLEAVSAGRDPDPEQRREWALVQTRFGRICDAAHRAGVPVLVDAEESWLQPAIDALVEQAMARLNRDRAIVFNTVQLYRHDRLHFLEQAVARAQQAGYHYGVKLVRGAYMRLVDERGLARNDHRVWSAQLLGMSDHISYNLAAAGYNVAKYVPYGPVREVMPYLIRRAAENTSARGQSGRELTLITAEQRRRARGSITASPRAPR
jgi:proline dehydrogenase